MDVFPALWKDLEDLIARGILVAPPSVLGELSARDDELQHWARQQRRLFRDPTEYEAKKAMDLIRRYPHWVDHRAEREVADPFVVAQAMALSWTVVTSEKPNRSSDKPRIPDVCESHDVRWTELLGMFRQLGWRYDR